jgi:glycosyltransferase involved in cell wall biosynthesis
MRLPRILIVRRSRRGSPPTKYRVRRRRVVFLIRSLDIGGAQRQLVELAGGLHRADWHVTVVVFYGGGELEADLIKHGVSVQSMAKSGRWDVVGFSYRLLRALRREHPDVLHGYMATENLLSTAMQLFIPGMRVVWGVRASNMDLDEYDWLARFLFRIGCWFSRFADLVICNSAAGKEFHAAHGYPPSRMVVIPNGIDSERFRPEPGARSETRRRFAIDHDHLLVGLVARLDPMKDHETFLRAAAVASRERPELRFVCVGDGPEPYRGRLIALASELGLDERLTWAGSRIDMPNIFNALDLAVLSSRWGEGFPNVVAEAMATGVPCVVTDVGDAPSVVRDTGWVCAPHDPAELARAMTVATASRRDLAAYGQRARQRVRTEFSIDRLTFTTSQKLVELMDGTS